MKNVVILDIETTGLDPKKEKTIEIGVLLYNVEHKIVLQTCSFFLPCEENPVEHINNIKSEWTNQHNSNVGGIFMLKDMVINSDAVIAHNAKFDKGFMMELQYLGEDFWKTSWICTREDFQWGISLPRKRLQDVCQAMGVDYTGAHRSLSDCEFLVKCFSKLPDLKERLEKAKSKVVGA